MASISVDQIEPTLETVRHLIRRLTVEKRQRLRLLLDEDFKREDLGQLDPIAPPMIPPEEFAAKWELERRWLEENAQKYAGRWVALDGDIRKKTITELKRGDSFQCRTPRHAQ